MPKPPKLTGRNKTPPRLENFLGGLELAVMEAVWQKSPLSVREVLPLLKEQGHDLAYTTVMTVMNRLKQKGWLIAEQEGRAFLYRPSRSRQEAEAEAVGQIMRSLLKDFGDIAVAQFVKELDDIDPQSLSWLAELAQQASGDKDG